MKLWVNNFGVKPEDVRVVMTPIYSEDGIKNCQLKVSEYSGKFDSSPMEKRGYMDLGLREENIFVTKTENEDGSNLIKNNAIVYVVPPYGIGVGYVDVRDMVEVDGGLKKEKGFLSL